MTAYWSRGMIVLQEGGDAQAAFDALYGGIDTFVAFLFTLVIIGLIGYGLYELSMVGFSRNSMKNSSQNGASSHAKNAMKAFGVAALVVVAPQVLVELGFVGAETFANINLFAS